jgi:hypothetical protein
LGKFSKALEKKKRRARDAREPPPENLKFVTHG